MTGDTEETLAARVLKVEHRIYPAALRLVAEGRVRVVDGRCLIDGVPVPGRRRSSSRQISPDRGRRTRYPLAGVIDFRS